MMFRRSQLGDVDIAAAQYTTSTTAQGAAFNQALSYVRWAEGANDAMQGDYQRALANWQLNVDAFGEKAAGPKPQPPTQWYPTDFEQAYDAYLDGRNVHDFGTTQQTYNAYGIVAPSKPTQQPATQTPAPKTPAAPQQTTTPTTAQNTLIDTIKAQPWYVIAGAIALVVVATRKGK